MCALITVVAPAAKAALNGRSSRRSSVARSAVTSGLVKCESSDVSPCPGKCFGVDATPAPKHFPGHGDTSLDSHFTRPDVTADRATLDRRELLPFKSAFAAGATTVMSAHIRYTAL